MKSLLVYYSHYGNTAYVANEFLENLSKQGEVDSSEIRYSGTKKGLLERVFYRLFPSRVQLEPLPFDLKVYQLLCLGIPVWGGRPSAPVSKYLELCSNTAGKTIICFFIYNIDTSAHACFEYVSKRIEKKGPPKKIIPVYIPWQKVHQKEFLDAEITKAIAQVDKSP